jgi:hypothetical protein
MTIKQIVTVMGGLVIGALVTLLVCLAARIPIESSGIVNLMLVTFFFGAAGMIELDRLLQAGFLMN